MTPGESGALVLSEQSPTSPWPQEIAARLRYCGPGLVLGCVAGRRHPCVGMGLQNGELAGRGRCTRWTCGLRVVEPDGCKCSERRRQLLVKLDRELRKVWCCSLQRPCGTSGGRDSGWGTREKLLS